MKRFFILVILSIVCIQNVLAQDKRSETISHKTYFELTENQFARTDSIVLQVNERMGDVVADIAIFYSKGDKVSIGDAWIEDHLGNVVRKLKKSEISDRSAISNISLYEDDFVKEFTLRHNTYPYRICYSQKIVTSRFTSLYTFRPTTRPQRNVEVVVETSENCPIRYKQKAIDEPLIEQVGKKIRYSWQFSYPGVKPEKNAWYEGDPNFPELDINPLYFNFKNKGSMDSWQTFGDWCYKLNEGRDKLPQSEQARVNRLIESAKDDREKAHILYKYMQDNTRYINVSVKYGGLQTYPAEYVCTNKYGDCKALSNYMKALLSQAGIKSYYSLVYLGNTHPDIQPEYTDGGAFNHVILIVPFGNDTAFVECTAKTTPFGYIHSQIQNRPALLTDAENSQLINIPATKPEEALCTSHTEVKIGSGDNPTTIKMRSIERGNMYEYYNSIATTVNKKIVDDHIRETTLRSTNFNLIDYNIEIVGRDSTTAVFSFSCTTGNPKIYGNNMVLEPFPIGNSIYETPGERKFGVEIGYPEYKKDTIVYKTGKNGITKIPDNVKLETPFGIYKLKYKTEGSNLIVYKTYLLHAGRYPLSKYADFYNFVEEVRKNENKKIYIEVL